MKQNMFFGADRIIFQRTKDLRNRLTDAEIILWERFLKGKLMAINLEDSTH
jgi:hypothetical protein